MKNFRNTLILASCLLLAGCSSSNAPASSGDSNTQNSDKSVLRVGMECNYAPFNWTTTEAGQTAKQISSVDYCDGYDVIIATVVAEGLGKEVEIVKTDWDNLIPSLNNGEIDAIIAGMTDTPTRRESVNFTTPYYVSEEVVIVRKDSDVAGITSIQELSGKKVVGQMGTLYDEIIDQISGVIHVEAATDFPAAINALQHGDVDAVTSELPVAIGVTSANSDLTYIQFEKGKGFAGEEDATVSIAVAKDNPELQAQIQEILDKISEDERNVIMQAAVERQPAVNE
ncbi:MAG: transporter substrate-binding domain-containing protein [Solobacterium sp.]|nr:transporter substrate-binding domain-containing protein [Solobacterium sp.]